MSDQHIGERPAFTGPVTDTTELPLAVGGSNTLERGTALQLKTYIGGGGGGGATNLTYTASPTGGTVTSDTGTDATIPLADGTNAGLMAPAQHTKLAGIAAGATAVTVDATPTDGSGNAVSSNGVFDALAGKADTGHNHSGTYDPAGTATNAVSNHAGAADPHGDRAWASGQFAVTGHNHSGTYDPAGTASAAMSAHTGAADAHGDRAFASAADAAILSTARAYADSLVVGLVDDRGNYNASGNTFPTSGGSGSGGAVLKGDLWTVSVAGTLGGVAVTPGDLVRALVDAPGQTAANWAVTENNLGYTPENAANKDATGGYAGLTGFKLNLKNALGTITSWFTTAATAARTWTMPDKDGTVAMTSDIPSVGTTAGTVAAGDDPRMSDARTPTTHTHALSDLTQSGATTGQVPTWNGTAWAAATPSGGSAVSQPDLNITRSVQFGGL